MRSLVTTGTRQLVEGSNKIAHLIDYIGAARSAPAPPNGQYARPRRRWAPADLPAVCHSPTVAIGDITPRMPAVRPPGCREIRHGPRLLHYLPALRRHSHDHHCHWWRNRWPRYRVWAHRTRRRYISSTPEPATPTAPPTTARRSSRLPATTPAVCSPIAGVQFQQDALFPLMTASADAYPSLMGRLSRATDLPPATTPPARSSSAADLADAEHLPTHPRLHRDMNRPQTPSLPRRRAPSNHSWRRVSPAPWASPATIQLHPRLHGRALKERPHTPRRHLQHRTGHRPGCGRHYLHWTRGNTARGLPTTPV